MMSLPGTRVHSNPRQIIQGRGDFISKQTFNASQTIPIPAKATKAAVQMWGGTGGTGGAGATAGASPGSGAAAYLEKILVGLTPGNTVVYTQGAAGAAGASGSLSTGGSGTASTLVSGTQTIGTLTANGSNGTTSLNINAQTSGQVTAGSAGGTATGGDVNITGEVGGYAFFVSDGSLILQGFPGVSSSTMFSVGAAGVVGNTIAGKAGTSGGLIITWYS